MQTHRRVQPQSLSTSPPMSPIVYQIPLAQLGAFRGNPLVVRSDRPQDLVTQLLPTDLGNLAYIQLYGLPSGTDVLMHWAVGLAIDLVLDNPGQDFPTLYGYAKLLDNHPVRVTLPIELGFEKAVKLASSLEFAVRLKIGQHPPTLIESLAGLLGDYLHKSMVTQPIECFHSLLLGFCRDEPVNLWAIQEEDPALIRYVDEQGTEHLPGRLTGLACGPVPENFVTDWSNCLSADGAECADCPFFSPCRGYFKWPGRDYDCAGVKALLATLRQAADELRADIAAATSRSGATS
jgi:hypothetical protein